MAILFDAESFLLRTGWVIQPGFQLNKATLSVNCQNG